MYLIRMVEQCFFVKLFFVLALTSIRSTKDVEDTDCPEEITNQIKWHKTQSLRCSVSEPLCLSDKMEVLQRCCSDNGIWDPAPGCYLTQTKIRNPCPETAQNHNNICFFVIRDTTYPFKCPYEENLPFEKYVDGTDPGVFPIWMPVTRETGVYGTGPFYWIEATSSYKLPYTSCKDNTCRNQIINSSTDKNCLIYHSPTITEAVFCNEPHNAVCAYEVLSSKKRSFCSQSYAPEKACGQSDYSTYSKCLCSESEEPSKDEEVEQTAFLLPYQNMAYHAEEVCYMGLVKKENSYAWSHSNLAINYTNWASDAVFGEDYIFGAVSSKGWTLRKTRNELNCTLYLREPVMIEGDMKLMYDDTSNIFKLHLSSSTSWVHDDEANHPLLFCFTDASSVNLIQRIDVGESYDENLGSFSFAPLTDGPGNYWCEGFLYPSVKMRRSNTYFLGGETEEYVIILKTNFTEIPLLEKDFDQFRELLKSNLQAFPEVASFYPRIFKIVSVDEISSKITINFHLTTKERSPPMSKFSVLRSITKFNDFDVINLLVADRCIGLQTIQYSQTVTWPITNIYEMAERPREGWCINTNGSIVNRLCGGNFIDGAQWAESESCSIIVSPSNITLNLTNIVKKNTPLKYIEQVVELSKNIYMWKTRDLDVLSEFLEQLSNISMASMNLVAEIVNNIAINYEVLGESQREFQTRDKILQKIERILKDINFTGAFQGDKFSFISYEFFTNGNNSLILEERSFIQSNVKKLEDLPNENLTLAIILNENISNSTRVIIAICSSNLFVDFDNKDVSLVLSIFMPHSEGNVTAVYTNTGITAPDCSIWQYDIGRIRGYWKRSSKSVEVNKKMVCYPTISRLFALVEGISNITSELKEILKSNTAVIDKLSRVASLLQIHYTNIEPFDISLISQLLCEVTTSQEPELDIIADIVDIFMEVDKNVMIEAETQFRAASDIIDTFNMIIGNQETSKSIGRKNLFSLVYIFSGTTLGGFSINTCETYCIIDVIKQASMDVGAIRRGNVELKVYLNMSLVQQLKINGASKIMVTLFAKDTLFGDLEYESSSKIVSVHFPQMTASLTGAIIIEHRIDGLSYNFTCQFWKDYYWYSNMPASYENGSLQCQYWEPGYYSLHFNTANATQELEIVLRSNDPIEEILQQVEYILNILHHNFIPFDVLLIAEALMKVDTANENIINLCFNIVGNAMKIERNVLRESQELFRATDKILYYFGEITEMCTCLNESQQIVGSNMGLTKLPFKENGFVGVEVTDCNNTYGFKFLMEDDLYENIWDRNNPTILLSHELIERLNNITSVDQIIITVFRHDTLFNEKLEAGDIDSIVGLRIPNYDTILKDGVLLYSRNSDVNSSCVYWDFEENADETYVKGSWTIEQKISSSSSCNFYQQGYFTVLKSTVFNITKELEKVLRASLSVADKLSRIEGITYFYDLFQPIDLILLSNILNSLEDLDSRCLAIIRRIGENFFSIPKDVLIRSQIENNTLEGILNSINRIGKYLMPNKAYSVAGKLSLLTCSLKENIGAVFDGDLSCLRSDETRDSYVAKLSFSKELIDQIVLISETRDPFFVVSVFHGNDLFIDEKQVTTSDIFSVTVSPFRETIESGLSLIFNRDTLYNSTYSCAYWKYDNPNNYGVWYEVPTSNEISDVSCDLEYLGYFSLVDKISSNLTENLQSIQSSSSPFSQKLSGTFKLLDENKNNVVALHIFIVTEILKEGKVESKDDLMLIGNITSLLMDIERPVLVQSQEQYNATDRIVHYVDALVASFTGEFFMQFNNFAIVIMDHIQGLTFKNCESSCIMEKITADSPIDPSEYYDAILYLNKELRDRMQQYSSKIHITVYFFDALFNGKYSGSSENVAIIIGAMVPSDGLEDRVQLYFHVIQNRNYTCAYWNYIVDETHFQKGHWETVLPNYFNSTARCDSKLDATHLGLLKMKKNVTNDLQDILHSNDSIENQLEEVISIISNDSQQLRPFDIYLIVQIVDKLNEALSVTHEQMKLVTQIISDLSAVERSVLRESQHTYQATDMILHFLDEIMVKQSVEENDTIVGDRFISTAYDLKTTNIHGFMLEQCTADSCTVTVLTEINMSKILSNENLNMALVLSEELRKQITENNDPVRLVASVFFQDDFFNDDSERDFNTSKICGVLLPGLKDPIRGSIYLIHKFEKGRRIDNSSCAFWDYLTDEQTLKGGSWEKDNDPRHSDQAVICEYKHITHFVLLIANSDDALEDPATVHIMDIITNINSVLSLLGLFGILLTALLFDKWRNNTGNQILINFSFAISIKNVMLYISVGIWSENSASLGCTITGGILHYSVLSEFCWMLIIAILQFKRFVQVLGGPLKYVLLKACICGWGFPALPVFLIIIIDMHNYYQGPLGLCYPSGLGLYLAVWLPLFIIISVNSVIFVFILYSVFHKKTVARDQVNHEMLFQWRLALLLFFMLGLTWIFGFVGLISGMEVFLVLFTFFASLQGFLMFLFFIAFNKRTRYLYSQAIKLWLYSKGYRID